MPANFTRRRDFFSDAGLPDPDAAIQLMSSEVKALGLPPHWEAAGAASVRERLAPRLGRVAEEQVRFARLVPEWVTSRSGDLATALWLVRKEHGDALDLPGFLLGVLDALLAEGRHRDALAYARFMLDLNFDWERLYTDPSIAYAFLREREPNPLVWHVLDELGARDVRLRVLELGCGIGNDAFGFLDSPLVDSYMGIDISQEALDEFGRRVLRKQPRVVPTLKRSDFLDVLERPPGGINLVYSYSSLHYFSSGELGRIYELTRRLLGSAYPAAAFLAFGIKGAGSVWDGQGLPLYRPDVWVNWDGQSRWFPSRHVLAAQLDRAGFEIRFHERHDHWGYSEAGKRDVFHYVLCSPRS
jgi:SAM-dependent methyltransferase